MDTVRKWTYWENTFVFKEIKSISGINICSNYLLKLVIRRLRFTTYYFNSSNILLHWGFKKRRLKLGDSRGDCAHDTHPLFLKNLCPIIARKSSCFHNNIADCVLCGKKEKIYFTLFYARSQLWGLRTEQVHS